MAQQHTGPAVTVIPTPAGAGSSSPVARMQNGWLKWMRGHASTLRLHSGEQLSGTLDGDDSYTLALRVPGHTETALVPGGA